MIVTSRRAPPPPSRPCTAGVLLLSAVAFAACGGESSDVAGRGAAGSSAPTRVLGLFTTGEVVDFETCDGTVMPIDGPVMPDLISMHEGMTPGIEPFESVFVDLLGEVIEGENGPRLDALELRRVAYEGGGCDTDDSRVFFRGSGTEPDWTITIGEDGIEWVTPSDRRTFSSNGLYDGPNGEWMFDGLGDGQDVALTVSIVQMPCVNQMSGAWRHLSLEVQMGDTLYDGCAYLSPDAES